MNFLEAVQRAALECGVTGTISTVENQTGMRLRMVNWVQQSWTDLQRKQNRFGWMRSSVELGGGVSFPTVAGDAVYPLGSGAGTVGLLAADFKEWVRWSFRVHTTSIPDKTDEEYLADVPYDYWRDNYMLGTQALMQTRPNVISVAPDKSLCVGPPSNGLYTVTGDYFRAPQEVEDDADEFTGLPEEFQMIVVYDAMRKYAGFLSAPEVYQRGDDNYKIMLHELVKQFGPRVRAGAALA